jgi:hypothetical protein
VSQLGTKQIGSLTPGHFPPSAMQAAGEVQNPGFVGLLPVTRHSVCPQGESAQGTGDPAARCCWQGMGIQSFPLSMSAQAKVYPPNDCTPPTPEAPPTVAVVPPVAFEPPAEGGVPPAEVAGAVAAVAAPPTALVITFEAPPEPAAAGAPPVASVVAPPEPTATASSLVASDGSDSVALHAQSKADRTNQLRIVETYLKTG